MTDCEEFQRGNYMRVRKNALAIAFVLISVCFLGGPLAAQDSTKPTVLYVKTFAKIAPGTLMNAMKLAFEKANPNVTVDLVLITASSDNTAMNPMIVAFAGGEEIDVIDMNNNENFVKYQQRKMLLDLTAMVAKDKLDVKPYNGLLDQQKIDGKIYALPGRKSYWALWYNKDIFDKAKVAYPKEGLSWNDFRVLAKKLTSGTGADKIYGAFNNIWPIATYGMAVQAGKTMGVPGNENALRDAMAFWKGMWVDDKSMKSYTDVKVSGAWDTPEFAAGKTAMVVTGDWLGSGINADVAAGKIKMNYDVISPPVNPGVKAGTTWSMPTMLGVSSKSKNAELAYRFVKFMTASAEGAKIWAEYTLVPAYTTAESTALYASKIGATPANLDKVLANLKSMPEYLPDAKIPLYQKYFAEQNELVQIGEKTPEQAIADYKASLAQGN